MGILQEEAKKIDGNTTVFTRVSSAESTSTTGGAVWGGITGTLTAQTDLMVELTDIREQSIAFAIAL